MKLDIEAELATLTRIRAAYGFAGYEQAAFEALTRLKRIGELAKIMSRDDGCADEITEILRLCGAE